MKTLKNIRNRYQPTHYSILRVVLAAAPLAGMLLSLGTGGHLAGGHWTAGSHWN